MSTQKIFSLLLIFLTVSLSVLAQDDDFNVKKSIKKADADLSSGNYYAAVDLFEKVLEYDSENAYVYHQLADAYRYSRDYKNAGRCYAKVVELDADSYPMSEYYNALMTKMNGDYQKALDMFDDVRKNYNGDNSYDIKKFAKIEMDGCELAMELMEKPVPVEITHLNSNVNSSYSDFGPFLWEDDLLVYTSLPTDTVIVLKDDNSTSHYLKLYASEIKGGDYAKGEVFDKFNVPDMHTANGAYSPNKDRFYFTRCSQDMTNRFHCQIYVSEKQEDGTWSEAQVVPGGVNDTKFSTKNPAVATYKNGMEVLYYVSDNPEGEGGWDLWYILIKKNGEYMKPYNCGKKVNTPRNEVTPYYDGTNGTLYFSSDGWVGMGGFDVYKTEGSLRKWTTPENVGYPLNTSTDDMYYLYDHKKNAGYFASNRPGITSLRGETCCDDIFYFEYFNIIYVAVNGYVYDKDDPTETPLLNANVSLYLQDSEAEGDVFIADQETEYGKMYFFPLNLGKNYKLTGSKEGYLSNSATITTKGITKSDTLLQHLYLTKLEKGKAYRLENIYYDYDKWFLREESKLTLDTLYNLLVENPTIIIELGSHTDTRGTDKYNKDLSQKRAESCVKYLIQKGISQDRIVAKGYGETQNIDDCTKYEECPDDGKTDCPCHQLNRRTEFKVIGELDGELIIDDPSYDDLE